MLSLLLLFWMVPCLQISLLICVAQGVKNFPALQETWVRSLGQEDLLEKGKAAHSIILAWEIPWTQEPGRLQSMGTQRVRHDGATFTFPLKENYWIWDILKNYLMLIRSSKKESCWFLHIEMFYFWMFFVEKKEYHVPGELAFPLDQGFHMNLFILC